MTTVINNPGENRVGPDNANASGGSGVVTGAVIVVLALIGAVVLALPDIRERTDAMSQPAEPVVNIQVPAGAIPGADEEPAPAEQP